MNGKSTFNLVDFTEINQGKWRCEICKKAINHLLLKAHSIIHRFEVNAGKQVDNKNGKLDLHQNESKIDEIMVPLPKVPSLKSTVKIKESLKIYKKFTSRLYRINLTYQRCIYIQVNRLFRKWRKSLFQI